MDKKLLTRKELAERYGVNVETVSRWVRRGCCAFSKFCRGFSLNSVASGAGVWG